MLRTGIVEIIQLVCAILNKVLTNLYNLTNLCVFSKFEAPYHLEAKGKKLTGYPT
jgi:hypothetical protein